MNNIAPRSTTLQLASCLSLLLAIEHGAWVKASVRGLYAQANSASNVAGQEKETARSLEPGKPIERELAGGQSHTYEIKLSVGQFLNVIIDQRGIDVAVRLLGPDGKQIAEFDSEIRKRGQESVSQVAEAAGSYRLTVQAKEKGAPTGRYEIRVSELRAATEKDRALQEAGKLLTESLRLSRAGNYDEAQPLAERALEIREKSLGPEHLDVANTLHNLANLLYAKGDYDKAEQLYQHALVIREKALGPEHPDVAASFNNLANLYYSKGDYAKAEHLYQRALAILEKAFGPDHPDVATSLNNLASIYRNKGDYAKAEPLYQRALAIREKKFGPENIEVAASLHNLANLHYAKGDYAKAEPLYQRALAILEKALGPEHPVVATPLNSLANIYRDKGDYDKAEPLYQRALAIREKKLGSDHSLVAASLNNLAILHYAKGDYAKAEQLYQRALVILEKALGPEHTDVALSLNNLANIYRNKGDYAKAEPLYQRALAIQEKKLGPEHPDVAFSLYNLANLHYAKGDYAKAEPLHQRALAIREKALGPEHPDVAVSLNDLTTLYMAKGDLAQAIAFQSRANAASERNIALNLAIGSERQKLAYLVTLSPEVNQIISLHVRAAPNDPAARSLAVTTILQRKGRVLDAISESFSALRRRFNAQDQALLDRLKETNAQLARLVLGGPQNISPAEHQKQIKALEEQKEELEAEISSHSAEFRAQSQPVTLDAVRSAIPDNAALIEFFAYRPFNAKYTRLDEQFGQPRYVAYVLRRQGQPQWVELGEAKAIDDAVSGWRQSLRNPRRADVRRLARQMDELVMRPVRALLSDTSRLLISPDGSLNLIPFAALVDERGRYLVERYTFSYLSSGRDLLRLQTPTQSKQGPLIIADPTFGERASASPEARRGLGLPPNPEQSAAQASLNQVYFRPLPGTAEEARILKIILPQSRLLTREQATETSLKQVNGPSILHIATHGFFLKDIMAKPINERGLGLPDEGKSVISESQTAGGIEALYYSGLALAGANQRKSGEDDGVLTALEATGLDLWGTKLVVLSACDTGIGEIKNGEGVYGLRRALVLAGSESQVMSLWPVSDKSTQDLMVAYYRALAQGRGRSEALREVQLKTLRSENRQHPFYWASFIQSGEWANLEGKR